MDLLSIVLVLIVLHIIQLRILFWFALWVWDYEWDTSRMCIFSLPPLSLFLSLSLSFSLQNTNNVETAYYELYTIPRDVDPSNPECKLAKHIHVHVCIVRFSLFHHLVLLFLFCFYYPPSDLTLTSLWPHLTLLSSLLFSSPLSFLLVSSPLLSPFFSSPLLSSPLLSASLLFSPLLFSSFSVLIFHSYYHRCRRETITRYYCCVGC